jgi:LmbE family N-acetylglucosaminyl deacetylase
MAPDSQRLSLAEPAGFVSPHLDDVVFSASQALAAAPGSQVITVFASGPESVDPLPSWDAQCRCFKPGDNVAAIRSLEDDAALALLGATGRRLDLWPRQYRRPEPIRFPRIRRPAARHARQKLTDAELEREVAHKLAVAIQQVKASTWFVPLGVGHPDHRLTANACLSIARLTPDIRWVLYEDLPYSRESIPGRDGAFKSALDAGFELQPVYLDTEPDAEAKGRAVDCYRSQLNALGDRVQIALSGPERYFLVGNTAQSQDCCGA